MWSGLIWFLLCSFIVVLLFHTVNALNWIHVMFWRVLWQLRWNADWWNEMDIVLSGSKWGALQALWELWNVCAYTWAWPRRVSSGKAGGFTGLMKVRAKWLLSIPQLNWSWEPMRALSRGALQRHIMLKIFVLTHQGSRLKSWNNFSTFSVYLMKGKVRRYVFTALTSSWNQIY